MKTSVLVSAIAGSVLVASFAQAAVLKHFGFDNSSLSANVGGGSLTAVGTTSFFGGTSLGQPGSGSPPSAPTGQSGSNAIAVVGPAGGSLTFSVNTTNYTNIIFSFASQRTGTGGTNATAQFSLDGVNFSNLGIFTPGSSSPGFAAASITPSDYFFSFNAAGAANKSSVFFRISIPGASSASGNQRYDNLVVEGTVIPAPASLALAGLGGLIAARRRRSN